MKKFDVIVIGSGAAGILAAGKAAREGASVLVIEKNKIPGKKMLITGKGRCNITNMGSKKEYYKCIFPTPRFLNASFGIFFNQDIIKLLSENGLDTIIERGNRVFPSSGKAADVVDTLYKWAKTGGAVFRFETVFIDFLFKDETITDIEVMGSEGKEILHARTFIVCSGGCSYPATGSTGDVFPKLEKLGHRVTHLLPSLVPLESGGTIAKDLQGLSLKNIQANVWVENKKVAGEFGEMLFTSFGLSGPVILTLSRVVVEALHQNMKVDISIDLKPALDDQKLDKRLVRDLNDHGKKKMINIFKLWLPSKMVPVFLELAAIDPGMEGHQLTAKKRKQVRVLMKNFSFSIKNHRPFKEAIITAGGIDCREIDSNSLRSKLHPNLFFAGEMLELYGDTGGYNLQIAFSTGWLAGLSAAKSVTGN